MFLSWTKCLLMLIWPIFALDQDPDKLLTGARGTHCSERIICICHMQLEIVYTKKLLIDVLKLLNH